LENLLNFTQNLTEVNFNKVKITDKNCLLLSTFISNLSQLTTLKLSYNKIRAPGAIQLLSKITDLTPLKFLDLSWNALDSIIPEEGALGTAIANAVNLNSL
jgi:Ran GTPase-activating protein (RanGAP) involved in mRNA processing and transport